VIFGLQRGKNVKTWHFWVKAHAKIPKYGVIFVKIYAKIPKYGVALTKQVTKLIECLHLGCESDDSNKRVGPYHSI
jgi:hypothetical protein